MAMRKAGLMDSMLVTERFAYWRKNNLYKFNVYWRKDETGRLPRLNAYCSYRAKPLNGSFAGLDHSAELVAILEVKLMFARVTYCELVNDN